MSISSNKKTSKKILDSLIEEIQKEMNAVKIRAGEAQEDLNGLAKICIQNANAYSNIIQNADEAYEEEGENAIQGHQEALQYFDKQLKDIEKQQLQVISVKSTKKGSPSKSETDEISSKKIQSAKSLLVSLSNKIDELKNKGNELGQQLERVQNCRIQRAEFDKLVTDGEASIDPGLWEESDITACMQEIQELDKLVAFGDKFKNKSDQVKETYKNCSKMLAKNMKVSDIVVIVANNPLSQEALSVITNIMEDKAEEEEDVSNLLNNYNECASFNAGKSIFLNRIKKLINEADMEKLSEICGSIGNNLPADVRTAIKSKITQLIQSANSPAALKELYDKVNDNIKNIVTQTFVKSEFTKHVNHLIDVDLQQNYQSNQTFNPTKLDKQLKTLKQKLQDYQVLDEEFAKIAIARIGDTVNTILEEGQFNDISTPGKNSTAITSAIDALTQQLKSIPVQNRLYENTLQRKAQTFQNLNFVSDADKNKADKFKQEEQDYQKVIQNFDAIVTKSHTDLVKNVNDLIGKTKSPIDVVLTNGVANSYDDVLSKSTTALDAIKNDVARITQDPTLNELFDNSIQIDDINNLEKATLQRLNTQLDGVLREANAKIQQITNDLADQLEDVEPIAPLKDLSDASLQAFKTSLENMKKAIKENKKQQLEDLKQKEEEKEDGTKDIPDEIMNDPEVQAQKDVVTKMLNKQTVSISANGAAELLKQSEALEKYNRLIAKKINDKKKKDEEDKKKKDEEDKKKKEDKEKKKKEKEQKAKEKEEKQKIQQAKNADLAQERLVKQDYQQKVDQLDQYKKDNPEPEANIGLCVLSFILGVFPLFIYLASVNSDKQEYNKELEKLNKEVKDAKGVYDAKHNENMQKYNTPNSTRIIKNASPEFNSQNLVKEPLQKP